VRLTVARRLHWFALALLGAVATAQAAPFSMRPGFAAYYRDYPPADAVPDTAGRALLARFRPRYFVADGQPLFIDFYADYIAQGKLTDGAGKPLGERVTREQLNRHRDDPDVTFTHLDRNRRGVPLAYGRIDRDTLHVGGGTLALTFLTYHVVYRASGLPLGVDGWRAALIGLAGSLDDWHQLDHYLATTVVLIDERPVALLLQQHNYRTAYVVGSDIVRPADNRFAVDIALRSNELYPHTPQRRRHRAVRFLDADSARYLVSGETPPLTAADDITDGQVEVSYRLAFLPPTDAFYTFRGRLGERRLAPGRDGPPGADFNTVPALKPPAVELAVALRRDGDLEYVELLERWYESADSTLPETVRERYAERLTEALREAGHPLPTSSLAE